MLHSSELHYGHFYVQGHPNAIYLVCIIPNPFFVFQGMSWIYDSDNFILSAPQLAASSETVSDLGTLAHILKVKLLIDTL